MTNIAQACRHLVNNLNLLCKVEVKACLLIMAKLTLTSHNCILVSWRYHSGRTSCNHSSVLSTIHLSVCRRYSRQVNPQYVVRACRAQISKERHPLIMAKCKLTSHNCILVSWQCHSDCTSCNHSSFLSTSYISICHRNLRQISPLHVACMPGAKSKRRGPTNHGWLQHHLSTLPIVFSC